jgi:hypothetical protein
MAPGWLFGHHLVHDPSGARLRGRSPQLDPEVFLTPKLRGFQSSASVIGAPRIPR